jgi:plastocyanin
MMGTHLLALVATVALLSVACAEEGGPRAGGAAGAQVAESPTAVEDIPCDPVRTRIKLLAFDAETGKPPSFDKDCIAVPAGEAFTVRLRSEDSLEHNFAVFADEDATELLYRGDRFRGPNETLEYEVPAIEPAGTYVFLCDVHRTLMRGTLLVA